MLDRLWGCGDVDRLFTGGGAISTAPWPRGDKSKQGRTWDRDSIDKLLRSPVELVDMPDLENPLHMLCVTIVRDSAHTIL